MRTSEFFKDKTVLPLEIFPPRRTAPVEIIYDTLDGLMGLNPDFISVTYGAGGSENNTATLEIAAAIKNHYGIKRVVHLPGIYLSKADVLNMMDGFRKQGLENILALRGDINPELAPKQDFRYASDLISFIKENGDFNIIGACYPEGHSECGSLVEDIRNLKTKVDAGTDQLITQLFFDNNYFYTFRERVSIAGINVPKIASLLEIDREDIVFAMEACQRLQNYAQK
ncbi:methylenetetrahydrofolate reductase [Syntrophomonas sp.]|uniref:methylenetetrahydrofolate reductase n=1 Tax=Syntrophomonas sp. TaxID=2053627 RepID=UPI00345A8094